MSRVRPAVIPLLLLLLASLVVAGCGGGSDDGGDGEARTDESTSEETEDDPTARYADMELSEIDPADLAACPTDRTQVWNVLYEGATALANCGSGTATIRAGGETVEMQHGWCAIYEGGVIYAFGTNVSDDEITMSEDPEIYFGPPSFGLTFGNVGSGDNTPVTRDGTYVQKPDDDPSFDANITAQGGGSNWSADTFEHPVSVTFSKDRTAVEFTATTVVGAKPFTGTATCGDRIVRTD